MPVSWDEFELAEPPAGKAPPSIDWNDFEPAEPPRLNKPGPPLPFPESGRLPADRMIGSGVRTTVGGPPAPLASFAETIAEPGEMMTAPRITTPKFQIKQDDTIPLAVGKEAVNILSGIPEFMSSNLGVVSAAAAPAAPALVSGAFTVDLLHGLGQQILQTYKDWDKLSTPQKAAALTDIAGTGVMATLTGAGTAKSLKGRPAIIPPEGVDRPPMQPPPAPPAPVEPRTPQPTAPRVPRAEVPGTPAEAGRDINVISEIRRSGARTTKQVQELFPERGLSREEAAVLRRQAWNEPEPTKGGPSAIRERETEEVLQDVRTQPGREPEAVPAEEGVEGVQPGAEEKGPAAREVLLSPKEGMAKLESMSTPEVGALNKTEKGGATGWAFKIGMGVKDQAGLDELVAASRKFTDQAAQTKVRMQSAKEPADKMRLMQEFGDLGVKRQLANEAYEAATGMTMPEAGKPSRPKDVGEYIRKLYPDYKPPMPPKGEAPAAPSVERPAALPPVKAGEPVWMGRPVSDWKPLLQPGAIKLLSPENRRQLAVSLGLTLNPKDPMANKKIRDALQAGIERVEAASQKAEVGRKYYVKDGNTLRPVTLAQASEIMDKARVASGMGASELENLKLYNSEGLEVAHVSYNGRVWDKSGKELPTERQIEAAAAKPKEAPAAPEPPAENAELISKLRSELANWQKKLDKAPKNGRPPIVARMKGIEDRIEALSRPTPAPKAEAAPIEGASPARRLSQAWSKYENSTDETIGDLVDAVEKITVESSEPMIEMERAVEDYREAQREDKELAGRGDMDEAEAKFTEALHKAMEQPRERPKPTPIEVPKDVDTSYYVQSDGRFVKLDEADESAIPYTIANAETRAKWPKLPPEKPKEIPAKGQHPLNEALAEMGHSLGMGKMHGGEFEGKETWRTPTITRKEHQKLEVIADKLGWRSDGIDEVKGKGVRAYYVRKATETESQIAHSKAMIGRLELAKEMGHRGPEQLAQIDKEIAEHRRIIAQLEGGEPPAEPPSPTVPVSPKPPVAPDGGKKTAHPGDKIKVTYNEFQGRKSVSVTKEAIVDFVHPDGKVQAHFPDRLASHTYSDWQPIAPPTKVTEAPPVEAAVAKPEAPVAKSDVPVAKEPVPVAKPAPAVAKPQVPTDAQIKKLEDRLAKATAAVKALPLHSPDLRAAMAKREMAESDLAKAKFAVEMAAKDDKMERWQKEIAPFRGQPEPKTEPKITSKVLKAQKEDLLSQVDAAIKVAPEEGTERITFDVEGDGQFTVANTKATLKSFRDLAKKSFPESVPGRGGPSKPTGKPTTIPKVAEPEAKELGKIAGEFVSTDKSRFAIVVSYADGTQIVSTDGRQLLRIVTDDAPGTPSEPVRIDESGKTVDAADHGNYPNWKNVLDPGKELLMGGIDTAQLAHLARQGEVFRNTTIPDRDKRGNVGLKVYVNKDGSLGGSMEIAGEEFKTNLQPGAAWLGNFNPDYLWNAATTARRLGSEKVDAYAHSGKTGPIEFQGKNHSNVLMPLKMEGDDVRDPVEAFPRRSATHVKLREGYGPLRDPDSLLSSGAGTGVRVTLEQGTIKIETEEKTGRTRHRIAGAAPEMEWKEAASIPLKDYSDKALKAAVDENLKAKQNIESIKKAVRGLKKERDDLVKESESRKGGEARPITEEGGAMHSGIGITPQPPEWLQEIARKAGRKIEQIRHQIPARIKSRPERHVMDQTADAVDTEARVYGDQMARRVRVGNVSPELDAAAAAVIAAEFDPANLNALLGMAQRGRNEKAISAIRYAIAHYPEAERIAARGKAIFDKQINDENLAGIDTQYRENYLPGVYDKDLWMGQGRPYMIGGSSGGISTGFKKGKTYQSPFHAIEDGLKPTSLRLSDMVQHRVTEGQRLMNRMAWGDALRSLVDPTDGKPVATSMIKKSRGIGRPGFEVAPVGYTPREVIPGVRIAVHEDWAKLFDGLTATSRIHDFEPMGLPVGTALLETEGFLKGAFLLIDTFHLARMAQKQASIMGPSAVFKKRMGLTLLEYTNRDLNEAVRSGEITQEMADYARANRHKFNLAMETGLNVGKIQENMYNSVWQAIPGFGHFNKFVFERFTRGAMVESWIHAFDKVRAENPSLSERQVAFRVSRDLNQIFGNLGRQGVFKDPTFVDMARLVALAPIWVESMARTEIRGAKQLTWDPAVKGQIPFIQARGVLGRSFRNGLVAYFVGTQLLNLATRGQFTWQNEEKGHKLDAWVPGGQNGFFISPFAVFAELTHDLLRYSQTEPDVASAVSRIIRNKLSPLGRAAEILRTGRDWDNEKVIGSWERVKRAAMALAPIPITASGAVRKITETPRYPGEMQRQLTASLTGVKSEPAQTAAMRVSDMARDWLRGGPPKLRKKYEQELKQEFGPSEYKPLRMALLRNDYKQARAHLDELLETKPTAVIWRAMKPLNKEGKPKPFTGSMQTEKYFLQSLTDKERELYRDAVRERIDLYRKFKEMLKQSTPQNN